MAFSQPWVGLLPNLTNPEIERLRSKHQEVIMPDGIKSLIIACEKGHWCDPVDKAVLADALEEDGFNDQATLAMLRRGVQ